MEYSILYDYKHEQLVEKVNTAIADGWRPCGGVCFSHLTFFQAMTKETE